jgi:hypothetical protein
MQIEIWLENVNLVDQRGDGIIILRCVEEIYHVDWMDEYLDLREMR